MMSYWTIASDHVITPIMKANQSITPTDQNINGFPEVDLCRLLLELCLSLCLSLELCLSLCLSPEECLCRLEECLRSDLCRLRLCRSLLLKNSFNQLINQLIDMQRQLINQNINYLINAFALQQSLKVYLSKSFKLERTDS